MPRRPKKRAKPLPFMKQYTLDRQVHLNQIAEWQRRARESPDHRWPIAAGCWVVYNPPKEQP